MDGLCLRLELIDEFFATAKPSPFQLTKIYPHLKNPLTRNLNTVKDCNIWVVCVELYLSV